MEYLQVPLYLLEQFEIHMVILFHLAVEKRVEPLFLQARHIQNIDLVDDLTQAAVERKLPSLFLELVQKRFGQGKLLRRDKKQAHVEKGARIRERMRGASIF